jgi:hypothetical protein
MKIKITIEIESTLLRKVQKLAAEDGVTVGTLLATHLRQIGREEDEYVRARKRALARLRKGIDLRWTPPGSRDELHDRLLTRMARRSPRNR